MAFAKEGHYLDGNPASNSVTFSVDMEPGFNGVLVHFGAGGGASMGSVTLDGNSMDERILITVGGTNQPVGFYDWENTGSAATVNLVVTASPGSKNIGRISLVFYTDLGTYQRSVSDAADGDALDVNTATGDIVIGGGAFHDFTAYDGGDATLTGFTVRDTGAGTVGVTDSAEYAANRFLEVAHLASASGGTPESFAIDYSAAVPSLDIGAIAVVYTPAGATVTYSYPMMHRMGL
jgi:hypothetical protein